MAQKTENLSARQIIGGLLIAVAVIGFLVYREMNPAGSGGSGDMANLSATVNFNGGQFVITNRDNSEWRDITCDVNGGLVSSGYRYRMARLKPGDPAVVGALEFAKSDGTRLNPLATKPVKFVITATLTATGKTGIAVLEWD